MGLSAVYKTRYTSAQGGHLHLDSSEPLPIFYTKNSFAEGALSGFVAQQKSRVTLDNQFNFLGGLQAQFMMEAEMQGKPAVAFKVIVDEHRVTSESL